jgi:hypothetical protein
MPLLLSNVPTVASVAVDRLRGTPWSIPPGTGAPRSTSRHALTAPRVAGLPRSLWHEPGEIACQRPAGSARGRPVAARRRPSAATIITVATNDHRSFVVRAVQRAAGPSTSSAPSRSGRGWSHSGFWARTVSDLRLSAPRSSLETLRAQMSRAVAGHHSAVPESPARRGDRARVVSRRRPRRLADRWRRWDHPAVAAGGHRLVTAGGHVVLAAHNRRHQAHHTFKVGCAHVGSIAGSRLHANRVTVAPT